MAQRTDNQNRAMHKLFADIAEALDREGHTVQDVVASIKRAEIRVTPEIVKNVLWKPIQEVMYGKKSTTELSRSEVDRVYEALNHFIGREFHLYIPFPSNDEMENNTLGAMKLRDKLEYPNE